MDTGTGFVLTVWYTTNPAVLSFCFCRPLIYVEFSCLCDTYVASSAVETFTVLLELLGGLFI